MPLKFKSLPANLAKKLPEPSAEPKTPGNYLKIEDFPQNSLVYRAHEHTAGVSKPRHHATIHASDLDPERSWCAREVALLTLHDMKRPEGFLSTAQKVVFDFGHKASDVFRECLPPQMVWGNWKCLACDKITKREYTPSKCPHCGARGRALEYREVFAKDPKTGVVGSFDLIVDPLMNGQKVIVETKSEMGDAWQKRNKAEFAHEWRTKLYLYLAAVTPWLQNYGINTQSARIIYINKGGHGPAPQIKKWGLKDWAKTPFKEYRVKRDDTFLTGQIDKVHTWRKWKALHAVNPKAAAADLPDRICDSPTTTLAKNCAACQKCFFK